jgi:hypothetical protein
MNASKVRSVITFLIEFPPCEIHFSHKCLMAVQDPFQQRALPHMCGFSSKPFVVAIN